MVVEISASEVIFHVAAVAVEGRGHTPKQRCFDYRPRCDPFHSRGAIASGANLDLARVFLGRIFENNIDRAARRIAPEQGSLRSAQYFDSFEINTERRRSKR